MSNIRQSEIEIELMNSGSYRIESISESSISLNENPENDPQIFLPNAQSLNLVELPTTLRIPKSANSAEKSSADTESRKFELKPRFSEKVLKKLLMDRIIQVYESPLPYFEIKLYEICRKAKLELDGRDLSFRCIEQLHHLTMLVKQKGFLTSNEAEQLEDTIREVKRTNPLAAVEYRIIKKLIDFCSAMIIKWNLITLEDYNYRLTGRSLNVKVSYIQMIDLERMNNDILCIETFWFTSAVHQQPLCEVMDHSTKQFAIILQRESIKIFNFIINLNSECDFMAVHSIAGLVAARSKEVKIKMKIEPDPKPIEVPYQTLQASMNIFSRCFKNRSKQISLVLREMLIDLEISYRTFEKSMIGNLLLLVGKDSYNGPNLATKV